MPEHENILETLNMIREECLDIRTITMGVSLWDCRATAPGLLADQVYDKIMYSAKDPCDMDMSALAFCAPQLSANCGTSLKCEMKGFAKPLVICRATPRSIEKMKNIAICLSLKRLNALR